MKHCLSCLIYLINRNGNSGVNGEVKSSKSMLIKTGYPNLLHGRDFLCFTLMNHSPLQKRERNGTSFLY